MSAITIRQDLQGVLDVHNETSTVINMLTNTAINFRDTSISSSASGVMDISAATRIAATCAFRSTVGFYCNTTGGTAARINVNSYFGGINAAPTSGLYFSNTTPKAIEIHLSAVPKFRFMMGESNSEGTFEMVPRTANPSGTGTGIGGQLFVFDDGGGGFELRMWGGASWRTLAFV